MEFQQTKLNQLTELLADIATLLMSSGSNTRRVSRNVSRIANALGYDFDIFYSYSAVVVTVKDSKTGEKETLVKAIPGYGTHFSIVSDISILSWQVVEHKLSVEHIIEELKQIKKTPRYNKYMMFFSCFVGWWLFSTYIWWLLHRIFHRFLSHFSRTHRTKLLSASSI
ncbi:MAG: threonine/serine exporter family protein [Paludibacteraceae bacterium]